MSATADPTTAFESTGLATPAEQANGHAVEADPMTALPEDAVEAQGDGPSLTPVRPRPLPEPITPLAFAKRAVRGRYRGRWGAYEAELRVDVDGPRPTGRVSGDFMSTSGGTTTYYGSFVVDAPTVTTTASQVVVQGTGRFSFDAGNRTVRVTVPRTPVVSPAQPATLEFLTSAGAVGASYVCAFESEHFRTIQLEQDSVAGAVPFVSYDTSSLPGPDPDRVLTVPKAYQEAGIELQIAGTPNVVPVEAAGTGPSPTWSDAELHAAMVNHFSLHADVPQWRVWLLVATAHDDGYRGIMFDASGAHQRQGAAVFYDAIRGDDAASQRAALRTYVHELGHAFNLLHSWQKDLADPPAPLGLNGGLGELSWMNYVQNYNPGNGQPSGAAAYWAAFPFQFVDSELVHLRHGFRDDVIPGAHGFGTGAAEVDPRLFAEPAQDASGLALELRARDAFAYGEPVVVELKLSATDTRGTEAHTHLHPTDEFTRIAIRQPSGRCVLYRPLLRHCVDHDAKVVLDPAGPALYDSAYIGFGADGFLFEQPGVYELRAQHVAADGSRIVSNVVRLRVRHPVTAGDQHAGELMMGAEQGALLALLGSDSPALAAGDVAFDELLDRYPEHELATYARLARGVNALRDFKALPPDESALRVREAKPDQSATCLGSVQASAQKGQAGVDNITLNMVIRKHARAEARKGNVERAEAILDAMPEVFQGRGVKPKVVDVVREQAAEAKAAIAAEL